MTDESNRDPKAFAQIVKESLRIAQEQTARLRNTSTRLVVASIVSSAITTLVAGGTAVSGPVVGEGDAGWRLACILAAIFAFTSTICTGLTQQLKISERLSQGIACVGRLKSLDVAIATNIYDWQEITKEYTEIAKTYPEFID
jgi:hypothetical protein